MRSGSQPVSSTEGGSESAAMSPTDTPCTPTDTPDVGSHDKAANPCYASPAVRSGFCTNTPNMLCLLPVPQSRGMALLDGPRTQNMLARGPQCKSHMSTYIKGSPLSLHCDSSVGPPEMRVEIDHTLCTGEPSSCTCQMCLHLLAIYLLIQLLYNYLKYFIFISKK